MKQVAAAIVSRRPLVSVNCVANARQTAQNKNNFEVPTAPSFAQIVSPQNCPETVVLQNYFAAKVGRQVLGINYSFIKVEMLRNKIFLQLSSMKFCFTMRLMFFSFLRGSNRSNRARLGTEIIALSYNGSSRVKCLTAKESSHSSVVLFWSNA